MAVLGAALSFAWSLPWASDDGRLFRVRPLLNAVCYSATGLLAWIAGSTLSPLGHGFVLAGAALASGMLVLALTQVLGYARDSRSAVLGPVARWLIASKVRGVVLGGAVAAYGLLLRPVLYETLWFAALYEYIALLAMLVIVLMFVMELLRQDADAPDSQETEWSEWSHHQQTLESKADPRSDLTAAMRQRFVDLGDWKPDLVVSHGPAVPQRGVPGVDARGVPAASRQRRLLHHVAVPRAKQPSTARQGVSAGGSAATDGQRAVRRPGADAACHRRRTAHGRRTVR